MRTLCLLLILSIANITEASSILWSYLNNGMSIAVDPFGTKIVKITINDKDVQLIDNKIEHMFKVEYIIKSTNDVYQEFRLQDSVLAITIANKYKRRTKRYKIQPDCTSLSTLIVTEIVNNSSTTEIKTGEINLNITEIFERLRNNQLQDVLEGIQDVDVSNISKQCINTYHLLNLVDSNNLYGFEVKSYNLTQEMKNALSHLASQIIQEYLALYDDSLYEASVKIIGYADPRTIGDPIANHTNARIGSGCVNDQAIFKEPIRYVEEPVLYGQSQTITRIPDWIKNNCQLSALRAYSAISFIRKHLSGRVIYYYVAGGVLSSSSEDEHKLNRKIDISISMKGVKRE